MKKTVQIALIVVVALLILCLVACVPDATVGENTDTEQSDVDLGALAFALNQSGDGYIVTGIGAFTGTELTIPATYENLPVTEIAAEAFKGCTQLTSVQLPENLYVGDYAFSGCTGLKQVTLPKGTTGLNYAFESCTGLESATILFQRNTDAEAQPRIFENCSSLTNLEFGSDVYIYVEQKFVGKIPAGTAEPDYYTDDYVAYLYLEFVYALDSDGNELLDENGNPVISHLNLFDPLPIVSVTGGVLSYGSELTSIPTVAKLENYTVDGECVNVDGVVFGRTENHPDPVALMYNIWWIDPAIEVLDMTHLAPYTNGRIISLSEFAHCNALTTIKVDGEYDLGRLNSDTLSNFKSLTDIYFAGSIVEYLNCGGVYYGDESRTVHCSDGDISKELRAALSYTEEGCYLDYQLLYRFMPSFAQDVAELVDYFNGNAVPEGFDHVCGVDAWTAENEAAARNNAHQKGEEYVDHICGYKYFLAIDKSGVKYQAYVDYADAERGTEQYDLYQLYLSYRTANSRFNTSKNRRLNDLYNIHQYNEKIQASGIDVVPAIEEYVNVHLPLITNLYGCTVEYEAGKQGDLTAVSNLDQLPGLIRSDIRLFAELLQEGMLQTPAEAEQLYQEALAVMLESGCVTEEEINDRIH